MFFLLLPSILFLKLVLLVPVLVLVLLVVFLGRLGGELFAGIDVLLRGSRIEFQNSSFIQKRF